ncbi:MAG: IclR family transcriptional regulator [Pseudomonadota bacterium]
MTRSTPQASAALPLESDRQTRTYRAPAAEKALDILEFMAGQSGVGLTQSEIASGLGRSIHEIYRVLQLLVGRGWLQTAAANDRFRLSAKMFELAHQQQPLRRLTDASLPAMRKLAERTGQSCHLAILDGDDILIVLQVDSPRRMRYGVAVGSRFPIAETSSGAVLLSYLPNEDRDTLVAKLRAAKNDPKIDERLEQMIENVTKRGMDLRPSLTVAGIHNVAFPVRDHLGQVIAALTLPYLPQFGEEPDINAASVAVGETARAISDELGCPSTSRDQDPTTSPDTSPAGGKSTSDEIRRKAKSDRNGKRQTERTP